MIRLQLTPLDSVEDAWSMLQTAIGVEFGTLPPYLYAMFSIPPGENVAAANLIKSVLMQEMIHMCLACNILNALGGTPQARPRRSIPARCPATSARRAASALDHPACCRLSEEAMKQGMDIEQPEDIPDYPVSRCSRRRRRRAHRHDRPVLRRARRLPRTLPASAWQPDRNQITDDQFFPGQLFAIEQL